MKPQLTVLAISLALAGCGSDSSDTSAPTYTVSGKVVAQNVALDSRVCVDLNESFSCDADEPNVQANSEGEFSITSTDKSILSLPILAEVDTGVSVKSMSGVQNSAVYIAAPGILKTSGNDINGVSSLLAGYMADGLTIAQANTKLKSQLESKNITISGDIQDNLQATELADLEQNVVSTIKVIDVTNRAYMLAQVSATFDESSADFTNGQLTESEINTFLEEVEEKTKAATALNDTGVQLYFTDATDSEDVAESPASFPGQDAEYGFDKSDVDANTGKGFKFVKLDNAGNALEDSAADWSCVLDQRSGLMWEVKKNDESSVQHKDRILALEIPNEVTPFSKDLDMATCKTSGDEVCSTQDYINHINGLNLCGKSDWRLPSLHELYNIIDFGETEKHESGVVYGLSHKYFPHQTIGSEYTEYGTVWSKAINFNNYSPYITEGAVYYNQLGMLGSNRGTIGNIEIYTDAVDAASYDDSYQFPARLVSLQGQ
ncbi:DUF1566 domain-containing protein [Vibrio sp. T187]|uniref:Lcl C-terminal domain-containing protein n=1 Tax=Vibrio TaxID=662 RepID=UPI0010CA0584|nr:MULTISPECIES: DUF1566 domain-containing protein [Vibrio]MBW3695457.1 DUF1566 domain-containing protein [Vibrio sp. T187]